MNKPIKYHNDLNKISFSGFTEKELNLFFTLCFKAKDIGGSEVKITFSELRELTNGDVNLPRFLKTLKSTYDKLIVIPFNYYTETGYGAFVLFNKYFIDEKEQTISIRISEEFKYLLNDLLGNFTRFDLLEFVSLKSVYSKNLFKLLKQWETLKIKSFPIDEFRSLLGVPDTYRMSTIDVKILRPIFDELPQYFKNLKLEKIKTGRKVTHLKFTWAGNNTDLKEMDKIELEITQSLNSLFEKAKKNRFLTEILTDKNIYKLTEMYEEDQLKKGLLYIYKQVKKEVPNFTYLIKVLETGIQEQEIEIKVVPDQEEKGSSTFAENKESETKQETNIENPLLIAYSNFPETVKNGILESAKQLYLKDVNMKNLTKQHEKYFKAAEKQYIIRVLGGESEDN